MNGDPPVDLRGVGVARVALDLAANQRHGPRISRKGSRVAAWVIPINEKLMIARHTGALLDIGGRRKSDRTSRA